MKKPTLETRKRMSDAQKRNPNRYWLGKTMSQEIKDKIKQTKIRNGTVNPNGDYFKTHRYVGEDHKLWKGDRVSYTALHHWLYRYLGTPHKCEHCGNKKLRHRQYHWANKSGEYKRTLSDWIRLCAKCHYHYDRD